MEALTSETVTKFTDSAIGARGIDAMYLTQNNVTTASYPLYDAHGNMAATLSVSGGTYSVANKRTLDAWGVTRSGSGLAGSYCANLGHKQDDESGLVYMRARYYEQQTGRFLSLDAKRQGSNWYEYCSNLPTQGLDRDGNYGESESFIVGLLGTIAGAAMSITGAIVAFFGLLFLCAWIIGDSLATKCGLENSSSCDPGDRASTFKICNLLISAVVGGVGVAIAAVGYGKSVLGEAFGAVLAYGGICEAFIAYMNLPEGP